MFSLIKKFREWNKQLDEELNAMYAEHEKNLEFLARAKAGFNRQDRRHPEGFVPAQDFGHQNVKIGTGKGYSKPYF